MKNIQQELKKWAEDVYTYYNPKAEELNIDYYTQSALNILEDDIPIELMIIGINPGNGGSFCKERFKRAEDVLNGNCDISTNEHYNIIEWTIIKRLRIILGKDYDAVLSDERRFVFTNATFFTTENETGLESAQVKEAQKESVKYTIELAKIIKPKRIICLGGKNCADIIGLNPVTIIKDVNVPIGYENTFFGIPTYCIKHTSGARWASEEYELVRNTLNMCFEQDDSPIDFETIGISLIGDIEKYKTRVQERSDRKGEEELRLKYVLLSLSNCCEFDADLPLYETNVSWNRFIIPNTEYQLRVVAQKDMSKQYVAIYSNNKEKLQDLQTELCFNGFTEEGTLLKIEFGKLGKSTDEIIKNGKTKIIEITEYLKNF